MSSPANPPTESAGGHGRLAAGDDVPGTEPAVDGAQLADAEELPPGTVVGRYTVQQRIGAGGMGVVYAAHDPELDRQVALKVLHPRQPHQAGSSYGRNRLLREAQAMAKLHHPHVITIHDVGMFGARVFMAMEFVDGDTLGSWLRQAPRDWQEITDTFVRAGRGLAAAHAVGLVHRDFKPENVLVGHDSRVLVTDFGLARQAGPSGTLGESTTGSSPALMLRGDGMLTRTGALLGTPAYMAPEQHKGAPIGAAADQFSFCVALYEALYGVRPFAGTSVASLAMNVLDGQLRAAPRETTVPPWLYAVLVRGLATEPEDRFPSMDALLAELQRDPPPATHPWVTAGVATAVAALITGVYLFSRPDPGATCQARAAALPALFDSTSRAATEQAFAHSGVDDDGASLATVERDLDAWSQRWAADWVHHCERQLTHRGPLGEQAAVALACLDAQRTEAHQVVARLMTADAHDVRHAVAAIQALPDGSRCASLPSSPGGIDNSDQEVRTIVAEARTLQAFGRPDQASNRIMVVTAPNVTFHDPRVEVEALLVRGAAEASGGAQASARETLRRAVVAAARGQLTTSEVDAWLALLRLQVDTDRFRPDAWSTIVATEAAIERAGSPRDQLGRLRMLQGHHDLGGGRALAATELYREAVQLLDEQADDLERADRLRWFGVGLDSAEHSREATEVLGEAVASYERLLGSTHPNVAVALVELGTAQLAARDQGAAEASVARALNILETTPGPDVAPEPAQTTITRAAALERTGLAVRLRGDLAGAIAKHREAARLLEHTLSPGDRRLAYPLENLGSALGEQGRYEEAVGHLQRALDLWQLALPVEHPDLGAASLNLANALLAVGNYDGALQQFERCVERWEQGFDVRGARVGAALTGLGRAYLALGQLDDARAALERAYAMGEQVGDAGGVALRETAWWLAQVLWLQGGEDFRSVSLARQAVYGSRPSLDPAQDEAELRRLLQLGDAAAPSPELRPVAWPVVDRRWAVFAE